MKHYNQYDFGAETTDPEARPHKPAIMEGDYPPLDAQKRHPDAPYITENAHLAEQAKRREVLASEGSTLSGEYGSPYPDRAHPSSPEEYREEMERAKYLRACHGGPPDAPDALSQGKKSFKGLKG